MKRLMPLFLILLFSQLAFPQEYLRGTIVDATTGDPIPFANIGIAKRNSGTVSDEAGNFELKYTDDRDTVAISSIGYRSQRLSVHILAKNSVLRLTPQPYLAPLVEVDASRFSPETVIGARLEERNHNIGFGSPELGAEIAAHLKIGKETLVKSAHFFLEHAKGEQLTFRVNLYDFPGGVIGENLLPENVLIRQAQQPGPLTVDLSRFNLILTNDVLLSLEMVQDETGRGNEGITFRSKRSRRNANAFLRYTSQGPFRELNGMIPRAPKLQLGFYLLGKTAQ